VYLLDTADATSAVRQETADILAALQTHGIDTAASLGAKQLVLTRINDFADPPVADARSRFRAIADRAQADGVASLRIAADMRRILSRFEPLEYLVRRETTATSFHRDVGISSLCQCDAQTTSAAAIELLTAAHSGLAPASTPEPLARFEQRDDALLVAGELDVSNVQQFQQILRARSVATSHVVVDVDGLTFMDVATMRGLFEVLRDRPGIEITLAHTSEHLREIFRLVDLIHSRLNLQ
jgi:anti-anti-sigma factor